MWPAGNDDSRRSSTRLAARSPSLLFWTHRGCQRLVMGRRGRARADTDVRSSRFSLSRRGRITTRKGNEQLQPQLPPQKDFASAFLRSASSLALSRAWLNVRPFPGAVALTCIQTLSLSNRQGVCGRTVHTCRTTMSYIVRRLVSTRVRESNLDQDPPSQRGLTGAPCVRPRRRTIRK